MRDVSAVPEEWRARSLGRDASPRGSPGRSFKTIILSAFYNLSDASASASAILGSHGSFMRSLAVAVLKDRCSIPMPSSVIFQEACDQVARKLMRRPLFETRRALARLKADRAHHGAGRPASSVARRYRVPLVPNGV